MGVVQYKDFQKDLDKYVNMVIDDHDELIVSGDSGKNIVVLHLEDYNSLKESMYLLQSEANRKH